MSVVIETTLGDITVDLFLKERPRASLNFLKLCKAKYYNYNLFHTISRGFIAQTGDPTGSRNGGESIFGIVQGPLKRFFEAEKNPRIKHTTMGLISFVGSEEQMIGSQFFITLGTDLTYLDEQHCVFGEVMEGLDVLELLNEAICDQDNRPYQDVRVTHTVVLDDPFPDPKGFLAPSRSPSPSAERLQGGRIAPDEDIDETHGKSIREINEVIAEKEAKARAAILEMIGDIPDADMAPPENVLFVCKLNPVTTDDDLEIIFSRFGKIKSSEVIRDKKSGESLQYAFVEFEEEKSCEDAYFKMDNVLIDDRRIHVDFSQSVAKVKWHGKGRGVTTFDDKGQTNNDKKNDIGNGKYRRNYNSRERSPINIKQDRNQRDRNSRYKNLDEKPRSNRFENKNHSRSSSEGGDSRRNENRHGRDSTNKNYEYIKRRSPGNNKYRERETKESSSKRNNTEHYRTDRIEKVLRSRSRSGNRESNRRYFPNQTRNDNRRESQKRRDEERRDPESRRNYSPEEYRRGSYGKRRNEHKRYSPDNRRGGIRGYSPENRKQQEKYSTELQRDEERRRSPDRRRNEDQKMSSQARRTAKRYSPENRKYKYTTLKQKRSKSRSPMKKKSNSSESDLSDEEVNHKTEARRRSLERRVVKERRNSPQKHRYEGPLEKRGNEERRNTVPEFKAKYSESKSPITNRSKSSDSASSDEDRSERRPLPSKRQITREKAYSTQRQSGRHSPERRMIKDGRISVPQPRNEGSNHSHENSRNKDSKYKRERSKSTSPSKLKSKCSERNTSDDDMKEGKKLSIPKKTKRYESSSDDEEAKNKKRKKKGHETESDSSDTEGSSSSEERTSSEESSDEKNKTGRKRSKVKSGKKNKRKSKKSKKKRRRSN